MKKILLLTLLGLIFITSCGKKQAVDPNTPADIDQAKKEGKYVTYGQPDDWANWKGVFGKFNSMFGSTRVDTDMSSAEEITKFKAEANNPQADSAEIGMVWGKIFPQIFKRSFQEFMSHKTQHNLK